MTRSSWMIFYRILIIVQHFFIIFLVSRKFLRRIDCPSNSLSVTYSNLELSSLDTTLQFHGIVPRSPSSNLSTSDLFQKQAPHSFPLSVSVPFTTATVHGLKLISNHSVESNVPITTLPSYLWRGRQHLSVYSSNVKLILLHHPFFFALIGPNQSSYKD